MKFSLLINTSPTSDATSYTALNFARSVVESGHVVYRLFFYSEGVYNGTQANITPQDEHDLPEAWQSFIAMHQIDAVVCIAAALRRGILDKNEVERYESIGAPTLRTEFELSGLGQLVDAAVYSDRLITFG